MSYQGRRKDQMEYSYKVAFYGLCGIVAVILLNAIFN